MDMYFHHIERVMTWGFCVFGDRDNDSPWRSPSILRKIQERLRKSNLCLA